jgi:hypothetical protein
MGQSLYRDVKAGNVAAVKRDLEYLSKKGKPDPECGDINAYDLDGLALAHWASRLGHAEV